MDITFKLNELESAAKKFLANSSGYRVFALEGEMGAGKTTFITAVCRQLGVADTTGSPTYSIINQYDSPEGTISHIDLYRLKDEEEVLQAGVGDAIDNSRYCFIEWPRAASALLPDTSCWLSLEVLPDQTRKLTLQEPIR